MQYLYIHQQHLFPYLALLGRRWSKSHVKRWLSGMWGEFHLLLPPGTHEAHSWWWLGHSTVLRRSHCARQSHSPHSRHCACHWALSVCCGFPIAAVVSLPAIHPRVLPTTHISLSRLFSWVDHMSVCLQEIVGRYLRRGRKECLNWQISPNH